MSKPPTQKKGLLGRFSAFLASDAMSIGSKESTPQNSPPNPNAAAASRRDSSSLSANSPSANNSSKFSNNNNNSNSNNTNNAMNRSSKSPSISPGEQLPKNNSHTLSPMVGHLESGGGSFASSASPSFAKRSSDDGSAADAGQHNNNSNSKGDAFKMFSIIGPSFHQQNNNTNTATQQQQQQQQAPQYQDSVGTSAARSRKASFIASLDLSKPPQVASSVQINSNNTVSNNINNNNASGDQGHHRRRSSNAHEGLHLSSHTMKTPEEVEARLGKLLAFFSVVTATTIGNEHNETEEEAWMKVKMNESPESATRTKDILEKIAESDHDIDLALMALKAGYGFLGQDVSPSQVLLKSSSNSGGAQPIAATKTDSGDIASQLQQQSSGTAIQASKRRSRSQTVAKADLMTLLTPLFPSEKPIREKPSDLSPQPAEKDEQPNQTSSNQQAQQQQQSSSSIEEQQKQQTRAQSLNTGRVHGNRYISADTDAEPQQWFFFGGCPVIVNYSDSKATIGKPLFVSTLPTNMTMNGSSSQTRNNDSPGGKRDSGFNFNSSGNGNGGGIMSIRDQEIIKAKKNSNNNQHQNQNQNDDFVEDDYTAEQILQLVNEQIDKADEEIIGARKYGGLLETKDGNEDQDIDSDLSSELSGRSFGSMVDIEELVRSLN